MATVFETRLIGNIGKDAIVKPMERGIIAINFPVAHNKNWKDKRSGASKTKTTWVNCTIWKREGSNMRIVDFLTRGTMVELVGSPYAKGYMGEDGVIRTEIRLSLLEKFRRHHIIPTVCGLFQSSKIKVNAIPTVGTSANRFQVCT